MLPPLVAGRVIQSDSEQRADFWERKKVVRRDRTFHTLSLGILSAAANGLFRPTSRIFPNTPPPLAVHCPSVFWSLRRLCLVCLAAFSGTVDLNLLPCVVLGAQIKILAATNTHFCFTSAAIVVVTLSRTPSWGRVCATKFLATVLTNVGRFHSFIMG